MFYLTEPETCDTFGLHFSLRDDGETNVVSWYLIGVEYHLGNERANLFHENKGYWWCIGDK